MRNGLSGLRAYQEGGPVLDKLKRLWEGIRGRADNPDLRYMAGSMAPITGELSDLVEIGAGLQDRSPGRAGLGLAALVLPGEGGPALMKILTRSNKLIPKKRLEQLETVRLGDPKYRRAEIADPIDREWPPVLRLDQQTIATKHDGPPFLVQPPTLKRDFAGHHKFPLKVRSTHKSPYHTDVSQHHMTELLPARGKPPISGEGYPTGLALDRRGRTDAALRHEYDRIWPKLEAIPGERNAYINVITGEKFYVDPYTKELFDYLPMDEASVTKRLKAQGYSEFLHGTGDVGRLRERGVAQGRPLFQVDNPDIADTYAYSHMDFPDIERVYSRSPNQLVFDAGGYSWMDMPVENIRPKVATDRLKEFDKLLAEMGMVEFGGTTPSALDTRQLNSIMRKMDYSGWDAYNLRDASQSGILKTLNPPKVKWDVPSLVRSTVDPGLVRVEGAKFDPRALGFPSQFAGIAGLLGARYMSNALREDRENG